MKNILFILSTFLLVCSCEKEQEPDYESFLIKVESIQIPQNIAVNEPFEIKFYGTIGNNGCYLN